MVHRVFRSVVEPVEIQCPAAEGDREADFPYLITHPGNRKEAKTFLCREVQDWSGNRRHLRMLVISPVRTAENTKVGNSDCGPESRTDGLLSQCSGKPLISQTIVQREPTRSFVRIVGEKRHNIRREFFVMFHFNLVAYRIVRETEKRIIMFPERIRAKTHTVFSTSDRKIHIPADVIRGAIVRSHDRIVLSANVLTAIEMIVG